MNKSSKIYIAGRGGMVGAAVERALLERQYSNIIGPSSSQLDLREQGAVREYFRSEKPEIVILAAAKVGGILANASYPTEFLYDNLMIATNVIHAAYQNDVKTLLFMGSSCIYPKYCPQPMKEEHLLTDVLESTNEPYAIAKIAGLKLCQYYHEQYGKNYFSVMPTNLYGPGDNFDLMNSHVLPALIKKILLAKKEGKKEVEIWGSGSPLREFLHVDDLAYACILLLERTGSFSNMINVGSNEELSILDLAKLIAEVVQYDGEFTFDHSKPDGTPRKLLDSYKIRSLGWEPKIGLREGIRSLLAF